MKYQGFVETQYQVGDLVRIVEYIAEIRADPSHPGTITPTMATMGGREFEVAGFSYPNDTKTVYDGDYYWLDDWLEPVAGGCEVSETDFADFLEMG